MGFDRIKPPDERVRQRQARPTSDPAGRDAVFAGGEPGTQIPDADDQAGSKFRAAPPPDPRDVGGPGVDAPEEAAQADADAPHKNAPPVDATREEAPAQPRAQEEPARDTSSTDQPSDARQDEQAGRGLLTVECERCGLVAPITLATAVRRALPLALVNPLRSHPIFATCPSGQHRAWLKPALNLPR